jgi:hypothetical protein
MRMKVKNLFKNKNEYKNSDEVIDVKEIEEINQAIPQIQEANILAYYDHMVVLNSDVICILGWEKIESRENLIFNHIPFIMLDLMLMNTSMMMRVASGGCCE